jgi:hypothetical protein
MWLIIVTQISVTCYSSTQQTSSSSRHRRQEEVQQQAARLGNQLKYFFFNS